MFINKKKDKKIISQFVLMFLHKADWKFLKKMIMFY